MPLQQRCWSCELRAALDYDPVALWCLPGRAAAMARRARAAFVVAPKPELVGLTLASSYHLESARVCRCG